MMEIWDFLFLLSNELNLPLDCPNVVIILNKTKKKKERASAEINVSRVHNRRSKYNVEKNPSKKKKERKESERLLRPHQLV